MANEKLPAYCFYKQFDPALVQTMRFDRHYLLYSAKGAIGLETANRRWVLPPSRAAWIAANTEVTFEITHPVTCCSVLFRPDFIAQPTQTTQVISLSPIAREMILHCRRWGPDQDKLTDHAKAFFLALAGTCTELTTQPSQVWLPKNRTSHLQRALTFTLNHIADQIEFKAVAEAAHLSERSLARRFASETGMTWRQMQRRMRMIRAIELLSNVEGSILSIALEVGYNSLSAFNRAFLEFSSQTPSQFRNQYYLAEPTE